MNQTLTRTLLISISIEIDPVGFLEFDPGRVLFGRCKAYPWRGDGDPAAVWRYRRGRTLGGPATMAVVGMGQAWLTKQISQYNVAKIITDYVNHRRLLYPTKKKRIVCDQGIHSLFGRKTIAWIKIYNLFRPHFTDNLEDDSDDNGLDESDDNGLDEEDEDKWRQQQRKKLKRRAAALHTPSPVPKSCYAAVIPENLKLVYLRRLVVEALLKQDEAQVFEDKLVGSFVRTKSSSAS